MHIRIKKGLDIPIEGGATGGVKELPPAGRIALNLSQFPQTRFQLLVKVGDRVQLGQPLAVDKGCERRAFVSPAAGLVGEIRRGFKRRLLSIVIERDAQEEQFNHGALQPEPASREAIVDKLCAMGLFAHIRMRPFDLLANPEETPRQIFVRAIESAPFVPPPEIQVLGHEEAFQEGLNALRKLTSGKLHLVYRAGSSCQAFTQAQGVERHTAEGPHPISSPSLHIHRIAPIASHDDLIWTVSVYDVVAIGESLRTGHYYCDKVIAIAGTAILPDQRGFFRVRAGSPVEQLIDHRSHQKEIRLISGDPLMGERVDLEDFLRFYDTVFCAIPEGKGRELFHFFRLGASKYTASHAYLSGFFKSRRYNFTTNQHGEERAFVDGEPYQKVMPMRIPVMQLVKALLSEDYELSETLGMLEVSAEDFALPSFVCPSKIEMVEIVQKALERYSAEFSR